MKSILLVENDLWLADSYSRLLSKQGYDVQIVADAETAMEQIDKSKPDVILADVMLEGHTVFSLLNELQSHDDTRHVPVILCSNIGKEQLEQAELWQYGIASVLDKSTVTPEKLAEAVSEII